MEKTLICDIGNVCINSSYYDTAKLLAPYYKPHLDSEESINLRSIEAAITHNQYFDLYELGLIETPLFITRMKDYLALPNISDEQFIEAWNSPKRINKGVMKYIQMFHEEQTHPFLFLSTSNELHVQQNTEISQLFSPEYTDYSCRTHIKKPHPQSFLGAANRLGVDPKDCFFIDDLKDNVNAALAAGYGGAFWYEKDVPYINFHLDTALWNFGFRV